MKDHKNIKEISSLLNVKSKVISKFHPKIFRLVPTFSSYSFLCSILEFFFNKTYGIMKSFLENKSQNHFVFIQITGIPSSVGYVVSNPFK